MTKKLITFSNRSASAYLRLPAACWPRPPTPPGHQRPRRLPQPRPAQHPTPKATTPGPASDAADASNTAILRYRSRGFERRRQKGHHQGQGLQRRQEGVRRLTRRKPRLEPLAVQLADAVGHNRVAINFIWTLVTGFLVMFMQAGFALVETGLCRAKNAGHTMAMNFMIYPMGMLGFYICGFAFMFGGMAIR